ncbi:MAG: 50S ribosomal protein L29 [candidate division Zixibacteria bacterium]|nr:50S ribosomal protein L29 [candidate division Zixibacteria bacterium]
MKLYQLKELTAEELIQKRLELAEEIFNLRLTSQVKKLDNPMRIRNIRREVARISTLLKLPQSQSQKVNSGPKGENPKK